MADSASSPDNPSATVNATRVSQSTPASAVTLVPSTSTSVEAILTVNPSQPASLTTRLDPPPMTNSGTCRASAVRTRSSNAVVDLASTNSLMGTPTRIVVRSRNKVTTPQPSDRSRHPPGGNQNRQRVAPPGSTVTSPVAERGVSRYTCHGGGPADGALYSAVSARPVSSPRAGHPSAAQRRAIAATVSGSVT